MFVWLGCASSRLVQELSSDFQSSGRRAGSQLVRAKILQNGFCADFWVALRGFFPDSDKSKALLKLGLPQLGLSRLHVIMLRCIHLEFARQCHCHGQIVNLLYLLILLLSHTVEPQGLLDCSSVGAGFCFPAFLKYCHVSVFSRGMLALGSVLHVHPGGTHSNNMCKMLLKRVPSKLGP